MNKLTVRSPGEKILEELAIPYKKCNQACALRMDHMPAQN